VWESEWEPYVFGAYVTPNREVATEAGYVFGYDSSCGEIDGTSLDPQLAPAPGPLADNYFEGRWRVQFDLYSLLGI
jgi:hypothetical protein